MVQVGTIDHVIKEGAEMALQEWLHDLQELPRPAQAGWWPVK